MNGKNILITGATGGIGRETARALAEQGAILHLLCRNIAKGEMLCAALDDIRPGAVGGLHIADLGDFDQVRQAADSFLARGIALDGLINNAGLLNTSRVLLPNGQEQMFAVNHLGHFLLTQQLMPALRAAARARITVVASGAYMLCRDIRFDDLAWNRGFRPLKAYGHSKLANILFMRALAARLRGGSVTVNALHPGEVSTGLGAQNSWRTRLLIRLASPFLKTPSQGAQTTLHLAMSERAEGVTGKYFVDRKPRELKPWAKDMAQAERLWQMSSELVARENVSSCEETHRATASQ